MSRSSSIGATRKIFVICSTNLRRASRDRANLFFVLVFPLVLVLVLGAVFGEGARPTIGVTAPDDDGLADRLVERLRTGATDDAFAGDDETVDVKRYHDEADMRSAVEHGEVQAGVVIPNHYGQQLQTGGQVHLEFVAGPGVGRLLQPLVESAIGDQSILVGAARFGAEHRNDGFDAALTDATRRQSELPRVRVSTTTIVEGLDNPFDSVASSQLVLYTFVSGMAASAALIRSRQLGVSRRMFATPTHVGVILAGEALGRLCFILFQGTYILVGSWLLFGVDWGDPTAGVALLAAFGAVTTGCALLAGALFANDQQVASIGVFLGLVLAALGGSMVPLEAFPTTMRTIAHLTPHAWANDGFTEIVENGGGMVTVLPELGVLAAMSLVVLGLGTKLLRRALTTD